MLPQARERLYSVVSSKNMDSQQLDPTVVALTKALGKRESKGNYTSIGDNGHSAGAYQWNNPTPLRHGEIPVNFKSEATEVGADPNDFSPANQDKVAYSIVHKWGTPTAQGGLGLKPAEIASKWNSGNPHAYKTQKPGYNAAQGVSYDTGSYVNDVSKYYQEYLGSNQNNEPKI